jgi:transglutaminase-like putative cysteine protease
LLLWLYVGGVFVMLNAALVRFHGGSAGSPARTAFVLLLQGAPIVVLLFVFFPRSSTSFRFQFNRSLLGSAGMSDRLSPGSVSSLALNEDIAFRVDFPDGNTPPISQMYWRGTVLWRGDGLTWVTGPQLPLERRIGQLGGPAIRQRISLQPHGGRWIFALDRPTNETTKGELMPGGYLLNPRLIFTTLHYEVLSRPENREITLPVEQMRAALAPALRPSAQVTALVDEWRLNASGPHEIVERALRHFHVEKFSYSLTPGTYGPEALDEFLFTRRTGFCEHYAAAFAALMRVAGIPSRVVIGYHGGELNRLGNYVIVRQSDAHAWAEVWLKDTGWLRVDPTEVIAPDRISSGLASFLQTRSAGKESAETAGSDTALGWQDMMREAGLVWDSINYQWELNVLNFDEDNQRSLLVMLGFAATQWVTEFIFVVAAIGGVLVLVAGWMHRPGRRTRDEAGGSWDEFCARLAAAGITREPWEGPRDFGRRAADRLGSSRAAILRIADLYTRIRYAPAPPPARELRRAVRELQLAKE